MEEFKPKMRYHDFRNMPCNTELFIVTRDKTRALGISACIIFELKKSYKIFFIFENSGFYSVRYRTAEKWLNYQGSRFVPYDKPLYLKAIVPYKNISLEDLEKLIYDSKLTVNQKYFSQSNVGFNGIKVFNIAHLYSDMKHIGV